MIGEIIAIFAVMTFVISNVLFRKTEREASPIFINFFRTAIGTLTFFIFAFILNIFDKIFLLPFELWLLLFISFLFGQVFGDTAYFNAQKDIGTTLALGVSMTFPFFTFILSMLFLNQEFEASLLLSLLFISAGVVIIGRSKSNINTIRGPNFEQDKHVTNKELKRRIDLRSLRALSFGLIASLSWAIGLIIIEFATLQIDKLLSLKEGLSSILGNVIRFPFAAGLLAIMIGKENYSFKKKKKHTSWRKSATTWGYLIVAALIGTSLGAYVYTEAARVAGSTVMSLVASASPLFSLPLTYVVNKERISKVGFIGVILTIIGVVFVLI
ncbi:MAG: EamA family transporter [Promethearchaeota archaeon]|nr:MAG: EamA family transporter [Candidatus Lokiarchaeota archaeon]